MRKTRRMRLQYRESRSIMPRIRLTLGYISFPLALAIIFWIVLYYTGEHRDRVKAKAQAEVSINAGVGN